MNGPVQGWKHNKSVSLMVYSHIRGPAGRAASDRPLITTEQSFLCAAAAAAVCSSPPLTDVGVSQTSGSFESAPCCSVGGGGEKR